MRVEVDGTSTKVRIRVIGNVCCNPACTAARVPRGVGLSIQQSLSSSLPTKPIAVMHERTIGQSETMYKRLQGGSEQSQISNAHDFRSTWRTCDRNRSRTLER
eukprot:3316566-Prymnesium_polylepis.3